MPLKHKNILDYSEISDIKVKLVLDMEIFLINSPLFRSNGKLDNEDILPPIGLGYIASCLESNKINVRLIDTLSQDISLSNLRSILKKSKPKFIGINIFSTNYEIVKDLIELLDFKTHIIIGGLSTQSLYKKILQWKTKKRIDIVIGDGELITRDIILNNITESPFINDKHRRVFRIDGKSNYFVKDISIFTLNRDFFFNEPITNQMGKSEISIVSSRGCIYNCTFCAAARSLNLDYPVRERSSKSIIDELSEIKNRCPETESIRILDDLFLKTDKSIVKAIDIFQRFNFQWRSMAHVRTFNNVPQNTILALKGSGCSELFIGIESGSSNILRSINKTHDTDLIVANMTKIFRASINVKAYFIFGFPDETADDMEKTYKLAVALKSLSLKYGSNFRTSVFQFRPYHGTVIYNDLKKKHPDLDINNFSHNNRLSELVGRQEYNFHLNNYSKVSLETIHDYICRTNII